MLLRFTVSNYRSFSEPQTFSMLPGKVRSKENHLMKNNDLSVLRFASLSGANASGKSNLINAVAFVQKTVLNGLPKNSFDEYCRVSEIEMRVVPSTFEFDLMIHDRYYTYGFDVLLSQSQIVHEWLYERVGEKHEETLLFKRSLYRPDEFSELTYSFETGGTFSPETVAALDVYASGLSFDSLLLSEMNPNRVSISLKYPELKPLFEIYAWFSQKLKIVHPNTSLLGTPEETLMGLNSPVKKEMELSEVVSILQQLGVGIENIKLQPVSREELVLMFSPVAMNMYQNLEARQHEAMRREVLILRDRLQHQKRVAEMYTERAEEAAKKREVLHVEMNEASFEIARQKEMIAAMKHVYEERKTENPEDVSSLEMCRAEIVLSEKKLKEMLDVSEELEKEYSSHQKKMKDIEAILSMAKVEEADLEHRVNSLLEILANLESSSEDTVLQRGYLVRCEHGLLFMGRRGKSGEPVVMRILFEHPNSSARFEIHDESNGTRRLLDLIEILCTARSKSDVTYFVDEIDMSLHPQLTRKLVEMFLELGDGGETQCIMTTHEVHILDLNLLRRDEIWFVEYRREREEEAAVPDPYGRSIGLSGSVLYSLEDFNERFDKRVDKAYLEGSYGAIPVFGSCRAPEAE